MFAPSSAKVGFPSWRSLSKVWILARQTTHFKGRLRSLTATCSVLTKQRRQRTRCLQGYVWMMALALLHTIHYRRENNSSKDLTLCSLNNCVEMCYTYQASMTYKWISKELCYSRGFNALQLPDVINM